MDIVDNYSDIIDIEFVSNYKKMEIEKRSAIFAPFAALTGYEDSIKEKARLTDKRIELTEEMKEILDYKLSTIISNHMEVTITYFVKDKVKDGGKYLKINSKILKVDHLNKVIYLNDKTKIKINDIISIDIN